MTTVKDFLNDTKVLNYNDFLYELKNTKERDLTSEPLETNMLTPKKGLIPIDMFLDNLITFKEQGHFLSNFEIKELENDTDYVYDNEWYTFNDWYVFSEKADYLAHDINMTMFMNNDGNYLVFLQVQIGLDKRSGFSSYVAIKFDTKEDYENAFVYDSTEYKLASCLVETQEGTTYNVKVTSKPLDTLAYMSVMDNDTRKDIFETNIYNTDFDSIKDKVTDYINYINSNEELNKNFHIKEFTDYNGTPSIL